MLDAALQELRASENKYKTLFNSMNEGYSTNLVLYDPLGNPADFLYLEVNKAYEEHTGLLADDIMGKTLLQIAPDIETAWLNVLKEVAITRQPKRHTNYNTSTGRYYKTLAFSPEEGKITVILEDITAQTATEVALRQSEEKKAYLLKLSDALRPLSSASEIQLTAAMLLTAHLGATKANYSDISGTTVVTHTESPSSDMNKLAGAYDFQDYPAAIEKMLAGQDLIVSDVSSFPDFSAAERQRWSALQIAAFISVPLLKDGTLVGIFSVRQSLPRSWTATDVELAHETAERTWAATERSRVEAALRISEQKARALVQELEKADINKNKFISVLSHELRNPLAVIVASMSLLGLDHTPKQVASTHEIIKSQIKQLTKIVDDLLDLTRINKNKIGLTTENVILDDLLKTVARDMSAKYSVAGVRLSTALPERPVTMSADPVRLSQCIVNLLENALKFTPNGGQVTLSLAFDSSFAVIRVKDTGIGIEQTLLAHLFEPFVQAAASHDMSGGGLGLGLSIVKGIAELHGGSVSASSDGIGCGAQFTLRLPVQRHAPASLKTL